MSVKVAIRVRPFNSRQKFLGCVSCVQMKDKTTVVHEFKGKDNKRHYFTFDYSFWSHDGFEEKQDGLLIPVDQRYVDQKKIYQLMGEEILENAWVGFNCCLFAYGQTGAGKSYSMIGYGSNKGIIPMACDELFQRIRRFQKKGQRQYEVTISMLQIYNEKVQDLLINTSKRSVNGLKIRENKALGVYVQGLNKYPVYSYGQIQKKMEEGSKNRSLASTLMNQYSSRAHTIVMLQFIQKQWISDKKMTKKTSLINLVDLAGSQRVAKTGVGDNKDRLKQASLINKSLHTLGRVIEALADQCIGKGKSIAVPYRQSALTRILENALGGNSKTTMICAISPANDNCEETLSTLRYADKTKKIKNKPVVNQSEVDKLIRQLREENQRLKKLLSTDDESSNPNIEMFSAQKESERKQMRSNVKASMRLIQKQIKKNLQSFAIHGDIIDEEESEQSLLSTEFIDIEESSMISQFDTSFTSVSGKPQVYITNLNEDEILNFKVRYSCEKNLLITNNNSNRKNKFPDNDAKKVVLYGLGIEENHALISKSAQGNYFIEALSETAAEYTLLNGKQVYEKQEMKHNDRIILGTNSIFLFKNLLNPEERLNKNYLSDRSLGYEFAINERQQQMQNESFQFSNRSRLLNNSPALEDKELLSKLQEIELQFSRMLEQNERKNREKEAHFKQKLQELHKEKQQKQIQKKNLESKLNQNKKETIKLRSKDLQIQKLQIKLAQFEQEKKKRQKARQSMLLDGLDINEQNAFGPKEFANKDYFDVVFDEYEEKNDKSALATTNNNSIQIQESYFGNPIDFLQQDQIQNKMRKTPKKKLDQQFLEQPEEIQRYNKIVKLYLEKVKQNMTLFTKLFDITVHSEQLNEFNCQLNGGIHLCRHCNKAIDNKLSSLFHQENLYLFHQLEEKDELTKNNESAMNNQKVKSEQRKYKQDQKIKTNKKSQSNKFQSLQFKSQSQRQYFSEEKDEQNSQQNQKKFAKRLMRHSKSNLSDLFKSQQDKKGAHSRQSRKLSDSFDLSDESLLLNRTITETQELSNTRKGSQVLQKNQTFTEKQQAQCGLSQSTLNKAAAKFLLSQSGQTKSSFIFDLAEEQSNIAKKNQKTAINYQKNQIDDQENEDQSLEMYISMSQNNKKPQINEISQRSKLKIASQKSSQIILNGGSQLEQKYSPPKLIRAEAQVQTDIVNNKKPFQICLNGANAITKSEFLQDDFDFSVSDIEQGGPQNSVEQSLNFSSLNTFKQQDLNNQIQLLKRKIQQLEADNQVQKKKQQCERSQSTSKTPSQAAKEQDNEENSINLITNKPRKYKQKNQILEHDPQEQVDSLKLSPSKRLNELPSQISDKQFLRKRLKRPQNDLEKELEANLVICNNENIITERNLSIRKRKRQVEELKKILIKKEKIQLQKQLLNLIPMIERFNMIAKDMSRLIQAKIQIQYKKFSHYDIIEALKNFTKSKWKKDGTFSNVQIKVTIANLEEARIYKWPVQVFKNRFEIAEEVFQKFIETNQQGLKNYNSKSNDRSKDPFWDPIDFVPGGFGYLSIQCLLYNIGYEGEINFVLNRKIIGKAFVCLTPVKIKKKVSAIENEQQSLINHQAENQVQIFNPRNLLEDSLYFTLSIESVIFFSPNRQKTSPPIKFTISYGLLIDDYKEENYTTPEMDFKGYDENHELHYLRRHCFKQVSESTLAYIGDSPIKFTLNLMKDYNEECLNTSFNQDLDKSTDQSSDLHDISDSICNVSKQSQISQTKILLTPKKILEQTVQINKLDFSKKKNTIYENTELLEKIQREAEESEKRRKEKKQRLAEKQADLKSQKARLKKNEKDCTIY